MKEYKKIIFNGFVNVGVVLIAAGSVKAIFSDTLELIGIFTALGGVGVFVLTAVLAKRSEYD